MLMEWVGKLKDKLSERSGDEVDLLKLYNCMQVGLWQATSMAKSLRSCFYVGAKLTSILPINQAQRLISWAI